MAEKKNKILIFLATLNFILPFVGYQLITTIFFAPQIEQSNHIFSQFVTIPYRAFALLISLLVVFMSDKSSIKRYNLPTLAFLVYWLLLIARIVYDTQFKLALLGYDSTQLWLYIFGICTPAFISVYLSSEHIDFNKSLYIIFFSFAVVLIITLFYNQLLYTGEEKFGRQNANVALNTISYGHLGISTLIVGFFILKYRSTNFFLKLIIILISVLGVYSALRASSRGPIFALFFVFLFYVFSRRKNPILGFTILIILFSLFAIFINDILSFLDTISPIMAERLKDTLFEGESSYRDVIYAASLNEFLDSPVIGSQFAHFGEIAYQEVESGFVYSHNIILDALMALGIVGGILLIYFLFSSTRESYLRIKNRDYNFWISLLLIQSIVSHMFSNAFYYDPLLLILLILHFQKFENKNILPMK